MGFLQRSLRARALTFIVLLVIVPVGIIGYIAYNSGRQSIENEVKGHLESVAILKEHEIENWVEHMGHTLTWLATSPQIGNDTAMLTTYTTSDPEYLVAHESLVAELTRMTALGHMSPVFLLDSTNGRIIASSDVVWEGKFKELEAYFIQGKNDTYVSDIFHSLTLGKPTMVVSTPVKDSGGQLLGVLAGHADLEPLSEMMMERSGLGESAETYLVAENNLLVTEHQFGSESAFKTWVFTEGVSRALNGESGTSLYLDYRDEPVIGAYHWMEDMELVLLAEMDQTEAFAAVNRLRNTIFIMAGSLVAVAIAAGVLLTRQIISPLTRLTEYARRVGKGDYTAEIEIRGKDEIASVASDVKSMVGQLLQMQEKLLTSERLATLGQLSGSISHELRNPLGVIDSSVYYLKSKLKGLDEKTREHLDRIKSAVSNSTAIIESLLNLTRMKEPQLAKLDLAAVTSDAIDTSRVPASVRVVKEFPEHEVTVSADGGQLRMAFKNIVKNAVEAMDGKGTLTVTVHETAKGQAEVTFVDTGVGIAPENLDKVFQPLFSTRAKGIGFGLSIVKMIVDKHGGSVEAESKLGKGVAIIMHLPLYSGENKEGISNDQEV